MYTHSYVLVQYKYWGLATLGPGLWIQFLKREGEKKKKKKKD